MEFCYYNKPTEEMCKILRSLIRASWYNYENNQQDALYRLIYYYKSALHVSGDVLPIIRGTWLYLQYLVVFTHVAAGLAGSNMGEHYLILQIQSSAPDDGRKHRPKHVELTWNNILSLLYRVSFQHME